MALSQRALIRGSSSASRRAILLLNSRGYASSPYPFTKPDDPINKQRPGSGSKTPYPFTSPAEPTSIAPPSGKREQPGPTLDRSEVISPEAQEHIPEVANNPDYSHTQDYRTSVYSPIPIRVMDGSEPGEVTAAGVLSGAPTELQARTVRIYKPAKPATQSSDWPSHHWRMDWDILQKGHRWENPLMGWQSSGDFMQATHLSFKSKEDAVHFAQKQGYEYFVQEPNERHFAPKAYADQFVHIPKRLKNIRTKSPTYFRLQSSPTQLDVSIPVRNIEIRYVKILAVKHFIDQSEWSSRGMLPASQPSRPQVWRTKHIETGSMVASNAELEKRKAWLTSKVQFQKRAELYPPHQQKRYMASTPASTPQQTQSPSHAYSPRPTSQIEAMPPLHTSPVLATSQSVPLQLQSFMYNPAMRHPVFFSESWHRPPVMLTGTPQPQSSMLHPVAAGYIWARQRAGESPPSKL